MADPAASEVVSTLRAAIAASPGVSEIMVDGLRIVIDRYSLDYWERRAAMEASPSTRPIAATVDFNQTGW